MNLIDKLISFLLLLLWLLWLLKVVAFSDYKVRPQKARSCVTTKLFFSTPKSFVPELSSGIFMEDTKTVHGSWRL